MQNSKSILEQVQSGKYIKLKNEKRGWSILKDRFSDSFIIISWNRELASCGIIEERQKKYSDLSKLESAIKRILAKV